MKYKKGQKYAQIMTNHTKHNHLIIYIYILKQAIFHLPNGQRS